MTQLGFYFDSSACSGCQACQVACRDMNSLPAGVQWRRVIQVSGGGWTRRGEAWLSDVYAYSLSITCNHCEHPICVQVCPVGALTKRPDGVVLLNGTRCLGCRYCEWACPYDAPVYDSSARIMTKCNMCANRLDQNLPPSCITACPLRVLDFGPIDLLRSKYGDQAAPYPLPDRTLTVPATLIKPHRDSIRADTSSTRPEVSVAVQGESTHDAALILFTVLAQMAIGAEWTLTALELTGTPNLEREWAVLALTILGSLAASIFHLGRPMRAWRALSNLRSSWLSREILFALMFAIATGISALLRFWGAGSILLKLLSGGTALIGISLLASMMNVYRLHTIPVWNNRRAVCTFLIAAPTLGILEAGLLLSFFSPTLIDSPLILPLLLTAVVLLAAHFAVPAHIGTSSASRIWRIGTASAVVWLLLVAVVPVGRLPFNALAVAFISALVSEIARRWQFYRARTSFIPAN